MDNLETPALIVSFLVLSLVCGCTGLMYKNAGSTVTINQDESVNKWSFETNTHTLNGYDRSGELCAALATTAGGMEARQKALEEAVKKRASTYSYEFDVHQAKEYSGGYCGGWIRFGGSDKVSVSHTKPGMNNMPVAIVGETEVSHFGFGMELGWLYDLWSGVYVGPELRMGAEHWTIEQTAEVREVDTYVGDIGGRLALHFQPSWLYGFGLHTAGGYDIISGGFNTTAQLEFQYPLTESNIVALGVQVHRQNQSFVDLDANTEEEGVVLKVTFH